ncbi:MAG: twin-arginine translocase subunit TatC [Candidatus Eremiobacteraeota bacterium]|nr:twin-arginine translocase subunit TatC [Candidatus Eremiobacteraeota bacterium]MBV8366422.1 twin-arginine translocase subunit TatC [Candidatus Eremiobacteraeota bacterium]
MSPTSESTTPPRARADDEGEMTFTEHLAELRTRLIVSIVTVGVLSLIAFPLMPKLLVLLERYFIPGIQLHVFSPAEIIRVYIKLSLLVGVVVGFPIVLYEIYAFVAPALDQRLRAKVLWYAIPSLAMSLAGIAFCGLLVLPLVLRALLNITQSSGLVGTYQLDPTIGFIVILLGIFAVMFQLPIVLALLASVGIVNSRMLTDKWRHAMIVILILAGIGAPDGNPLTMLLLAAPLAGLYFLSIIVVRFTEPRLASQENPA